MADTRLLDPAVLQRLSNIELVAKTVVDGFLHGSHRSPLFGFSQEFAEYRAYTEGDDPRYIDWNVLSRTDRVYIKRFLGETNTHLMILVDCSASMGYGSAGLTKLDYARYLAAALAYLSTRQHDATGLVLFDEEIREVRPAVYRPRHLQGLLHMLERAEASTGTNLHVPLQALGRLLRRRGLVAMISDFFVDADEIVSSMRAVAYQGQDLVFFHVLDPKELKPDLSTAALVEDMETGEEMEVSSEYSRSVYPSLIDAHVEEMRRRVSGEGADYVLLNTSQPLDLALREYLLFRQRRR
ncbi:MAG: DUF58 domain-containing protein [Bryobacterales bacterium]|nr:DUF58 domain-containing protein [Bryobacterales bacterium]MDE0625247.1 DUF58 domain-containing protein [Bryobacterales bacterium]